MGRKAKIWLSEPVENQNYLEGRLAGYSDGIVKLNVRDRELTLPYASDYDESDCVELY